MVPALMCENIVNTKAYHGDVPSYKNDIKPSKTPGGESSSLEGFRLASQSIYTWAGDGD